MNILNTNFKESNWENIGVYPTPNNIVDDFIKFTISGLDIDNNIFNEINILDIFCGDGRLGINISDTLNKLGINTKLTFIDISDHQLNLIPHQNNYDKIKNNAFNYKTNIKYDLVVCNPPYLQLDSNKSKYLGIEWNNVKIYSKNLYCLSILKCLELCKTGGILSVIAPFSYLMGANNYMFKNHLEKKCSQIIIRAHEERNLFDTVNQDIGLQLFKIKYSNYQNNPTVWQFGYNNTPYKKINNPNQTVKDNDKKSIQVRVGTIVWNRQKKYLYSSKAKNTTLLIYGGNIRSFGKLIFNIKKYSKKQYIKTNAIQNKDFINTPAIVIRRTLRGKPGKWIVDSAIIKGHISCVCENHVIVIEIPKNLINFIEDINRKLISNISTHFYISGSPSISVKYVKQIAYDIINNLK